MLCTHLLAWCCCSLLFFLALLLSLSLSHSLTPSHIHSHQDSRCSLLLLTLPFLDSPQQATKSLLCAGQCVVVSFGKCCEGRRGAEGPRDALCMNLLSSHCFLFVCCGFWCFCAAHIFCLLLVQAGALFRRLFLERCLRLPLIYSSNMKRGHCVASLLFCVAVCGCAGGVVSETTLPKRSNSRGEARLAVPHFNLADLMSEDEFADTEFIVLSQREALNAQDHALQNHAASAQTELFEVHSHGSSSLAGDSSASQGNGGVVCETVCRPRSSSTSPITGSAATPPTSRASFIETGSDSTPEPRTTQDHLRNVIDDMQRQHAAQLNELAITFNRTICESTGGGWDSERAVCAPFMRPSLSAVSSCDGNAVFEACAGSFVDADGVTHYDDGSGDDYVPCNPFQALALSHLKKSSVPKQVRWWFPSTCVCVCVSEVHTPRRCRVLRRK